MKYANQLSYGNLTVNISLSAANEQDHNIISFKFGKGGSEIPAVATLSITDNTLCLINDICGSYRIYYWEKNNQLFITDNVFDFLSLKELEDRGFNTFEKIYYAKHGYTSGDSTCYNGINKLSPCSQLSIVNGNYSVSSLWDLENCSHQPDMLKFKNAVEEFTVKMLTPLQVSDRPIILCFSGGMDSTYIAKKMAVLGIKYSLVFFKDKTSKANCKEIKKALKQATTLGKKLHLIDVTSAKDENIENAITQMRLFDNHYCRYHFYGLKGIKEQWGENAIIINGQNSDSILSYGPSEEKFTSFLKRYLLYGKNNLIKLIISFVIGLVFRKKLVSPVKRSDVLRAFYDNFKYCLVNEKEDISGYNTYLDEKIKLILEQIQFSSLNHTFMYLKVFTHMQGSDCQVVTMSAKYFCMDLLMPLSSSKLIEATLKYKNDRMELYHPKYVLWS